MKEGCFFQAIKLISLMKCLRLLTGTTLMSETPEPVSLSRRSLSGSVSLESDLFLRIDFDLLCVSADPSKLNVR